MLTLLLAGLLAVPILPPVNQPNPNDWDKCTAYALENKMHLVVFFNNEPVIYGHWVAVKYTGVYHIDPKSLPSIVVFPFFRGEWDTPVIAFDYKSIQKVLNP